MEFEVQLFVFSLVTEFGVEHQLLPVNVALCLNCYYLLLSAMYRYWI